MSQWFRLGTAAALALAFACSATARGQEVRVTRGGVRMVRIPGGGFDMGDAHGKTDARQVHRVDVAAFYMDATEVTQKEYRRLMGGGNPSRFSGDDLPVERIRWLDAAKYCNRRSEEEGLKPFYHLKSDQVDGSADGYRLPTEAEWEYAARAGTATRYYFGDDAERLGEHGWFRDNAKETTHPVGRKPANPLGLHDLYGNVAEWCHDWYGARYYSQSGRANPHGPESGRKRVLRGGSWDDRSKNIGSAVRSSDDPATADICQGYDTYGFRCVRPAGD